jgi:hypothetical protein
MRKLDKSKILATAYKNWLDKLEGGEIDHPSYNSSNGDFYLDIVANLLWIQDGLCAYSEQFLFDKNELSADNWKDGRYGKGKFEFYGHLEHYDEKLKTKKGWLWSNLFVVQADINNKKSAKPVMYALKPDLDDYNPFYLLEYNFKEHKFLPNSEREFELQEKILSDINTLGLNYQPLTQERKEILNFLIEEVRLSKKTLDEARKSLREYFTAFEMIVKNLKIV